MPKRVDASRFAMVPSGAVPRSAFDIQFGHKTTFDSSYLIPVYVDEVLPGDSIRLKMAAYARCATPLRPIMDNLVLESFFFYVPCRLLWSNWERFMGEQASPTDSTSFLTPYVTLDETYAIVATLYDYFGITVNNDAAASINILSLPFRAYNLIFNEWFRDQDLQTKAVENVGDGPDNPDDYVLRLRCKKHDYFTSARPWPQKPTAQLSLSAIDPTMTPGGNMTIPYGQGIGAPVSGLGVNVATAVSTAGPITIGESGGRTGQSYAPYYTTATTPLVSKIDLSNTPDIRVLVNDIRTAVMLQGMLERDARGGTRYTEIVRSHFGVMSPDARLQRPEYLGGGRTHISINPVAQTSASGVAGTTTFLGDQAATASAAASGHGFSQSFTEHGYIIGIVNVRGDITYQNGINRMWFRRTKFDFYWPGLAHLGEQSVLRKEIYAVGNSSTSFDNAVFGYQERWSEYKYKPSRTSGYFRSNAASTLDIWHLGENFTAAPSLNSTFITDKTSGGLARSQVTSGWAQEQLLFDSLFDVRMVRAMPMFSIPGVGGRL